MMRTANWVTSTVSSFLRLERKEEVAQWLHDGNSGAPTSPSHGEKEGEAAGPGQDGSVAARCSYRRRWHRQRQ
jgi:hypothetical protein